METICKFTLEITDEQTINLPVGFQVLTVQMQNGQLCLWALVDPSQPTITHTAFVVGTGNPCDHVAGYAYVGTVQERSFVRHVFIN